MKKTLIAIRGIAIWGATLATAYFAGQGVEACRNVVLALAGLHWFCFIGLLLVTHRLNHEKSPLPKWVGRSFSAAYLVLLVLPGYFACAAGFALYWAAAFHNSKLPPKPEPAAA